MSQSANHQAFDGSFEELCLKLKDRRSLAVLVLTSPGCVVCKRAKQILPSIVNENPDILFIECTFSDNTKSIFTKYSVQNVPQFFFLKGTDSNGEPKQVGHLIGFDAKEVRMKINQYC